MKATAPSSDPLVEVQEDLSTAVALLTRLQAKVARLEAEKSEVKGSQFGEDRSVGTEEAMRMLAPMGRTKLYEEMAVGRLRRLPGSRVRIALSEIQRYLRDESR